MTQPAPCADCPAGKFCAYPQCETPDPVPVDELMCELLAYAATWEQRQAEAQ